MTHRRCAPTGKDYAVGALAATRVRINTGTHHKEVDAIVATCQLRFPAASAAGPETGQDRLVVFEHRLTVAVREQTVARRTDLRSRVHSNRSVRSVAKVAIELFGAGLPRRVMNTLCSQRQRLIVEISAAFFESGRRKRCSVSACASAQRSTTL
jgi:hypothetical protein